LVGDRVGLSLGDFDGLNVVRVGLVVGLQVSPQYVGLIEGAFVGTVGA
jgi:hypothetical protein